MDAVTQGKQLASLITRSQVQIQDLGDRVVVSQGGKSVTFYVPVQSQREDKVHSR